MLHFFLSSFKALHQRRVKQKLLDAPYLAQDPWGNRDEPKNQSGENKNGENKNPDGPPDLEELFSRLTRRNNQNNNGQNGNHQPSFQPNIPAFNPTLIAVIVALGSAFWLSSGFYTVQERENGVETFLGKYQQTTKAGLNWNWPAPLGKVEKINVTSISTMRVGELKTTKSSASTQEQRTGQMLTSDENIVEIGATVQYRIQDAKRYLFTANQPESVLEDIVVSAIREVVGANSVDDILKDRRNVWPEQAKSIMVDILKQYDLGIEIVAFELQDARAPAEVQDAFEDAVRAREDEERARLQAEAFANQRLPSARGEAEQLRQSAQAYKAQVLATAHADVSRFENLLTAYEKNPEVMVQRLYLDTMGKVYQNSNKIIVDAKNSQPIINLGGGQGNIIPVAVPTVLESASVAKHSVEPPKSASPVSPVIKTVPADARSRSR